MPPFRQPTPSPPPPPVTPGAAAMSSSLSGSGEGRQPPLVGSGGGPGDGMEDFAIPANFVPPPPPREVATGVSNLGNTCYMNAALQALAHAPELCHALDAESHLRHCPVALRNARRRRQRAREAADRAARDAGDPAAADGAGKAHRRSDSGSSGGSAGGDAAAGPGKGKPKRRAKKDDGGGGGAAEYGPGYEFCTLCEVEKLLGRVHARPEEAPDDPEDNPEDRAMTPMAVPAAPTEGGGGPVVPETFVAGFMSQVAPWFRRGVQEDSHEFLRLLIDAMQNSCRDARNGGPGAVPADAAAAAPRFHRGGGGTDDTEYPFRLFRGTVESIVTCAACRATSRKIDPIEDVGLDVLPLRPPAGAVPPARLSSSRSASPAAAGPPLADVQQALERFVSSERLDSGYRCERCGKPGKATKTSKLASLPPILTLHLKRFRYGAGGGKRGGGAAGDGAGPSATRSSGRATRGAAAGPAAALDHVGPSGSAKVEGHVRFSTVLDIKPYLTPELQRTVFPKAICRLFAVVVHTGKNSHSGHYVAYVHNVSKKEWWKMDDAKIVPVPWHEVQSAEAYMLFYRVTSHPVGQQLKDVAVAREETARRVAGELRRREAARRAAEEAEARRADVRAAQDAVALLQELAEAPGAGGGASPGAAGGPAAAVSPVAPGKRARPPLASGEEWARAGTTLAPEWTPLFARIQAFVAEHVTFSPEFFGYVTEEYQRLEASLSVGRRVKSHKRIRTLLGQGPGGVYPPEDVQGGAEDLRGGILDLFHQISLMCKKANHKGSEALSDALFLLPPKVGEGTGEGGAEQKGPAAVAADVVASAAMLAAEDVPGLTLDNELIIPPEHAESYDGAL